MLCGYIMIQIYENNKEKYSNYLKWKLKLKLVHQKVTVYLY